MSFEIIIKERRQYKTIVKNEWGVIGEKEVQREDRYYAGRENEPRTRIEQVRGFIPEHEQTLVTEDEVYKQRVQELDLAKVIAVINGIAK